MAGQHVGTQRWAEDYEEIYDAITGARLDPSLVAKAKNAETTSCLQV